MTALSHVTIKLGHTGLKLSIPMIQTVLDKDIDATKVFGRGVIPDYYISDSIDDIINKKDRVLEFTKDLIKQKKVDQEITKIIVLVNSIILILISLFIYRKKKNNK